MKSIQKLREEKKAKLQAARDLVEKNEVFTDDLKTQYDGLLAEADQIQDSIDRIQELLDREGSTPADNGGLTPEQVAALAAAASGIDVKAKPVYRNLGEQLLDVRAMTVDSSDSPAARDRFQKVVNAATGASTGVDSDGGYLVETDKAKDIKETAVETGVFSSRCSPQPIGVNADGYSYLAFKDRDRSTGKMLGGLQVYRKGEADLMSSSGKAKLEERELRLEDMYGLVYVTSRMLQDAVALAAHTKRGLKKQLAFKLDYEIHRGTGAGQCLGITNSDILVKVARTTASRFKAEDVGAMYGRFYGDISKAAWFLNRDVLPQLPLMTIGNQPIFIPGGSFTNAPFGVLYGLPIVPVEFCKTLGTEGDVILADFSEYILIDKGGTQEDESIHVRFLYDEVAFRFKIRNNGQPIHETAITPLEGSNTLSPFVTLTDAAG